MRRRDLLAAALLLAGPAAPWAQPAKRFRIAWVYEFRTENEFQLKRLSDALARQGLVEGGNVDFLFPEPLHGDAETRKAAVRTLVERGPDLLIAGATSNTRAAQQATRTIPIVFFNVADPVSAGFVRSLAKPGGNLTGVSVHNLKLFPKRLELIRELLPHATRVALVFDGAFVRNGFPPLFYKEVHDTAKALGLELVDVDIEHMPGGLEEGIRSAAKSRVDIVLPLGPWPSNRNLAFKFAEAQDRYRVPILGYTIYRGGPLDGLLVQFGASGDELVELAAEIAAQVLRGVHPRDIPVRQATKVDLVLNLKVARDFGISVPNQILWRADRVIE